MAILKVTILCNFVGQPACGFSESWVQEKGVSDFREAAVDLARFRRGTLSRDWVVQGVRASQLKIAARVSPLTGFYISEELVQLPCTAFGASAVGQLGRADIPWASVFVKMPTTGPGATVHRPRLFQMRGVPDDLWVNAAFSKSVAGTQLGPWLTAVSSVVGRFACGHAWIPPGAAAGDSPTFAQYDSFCIERASARRIGRPFGLLRGRQSAVVAVA